MKISVHDLNVLARAASFGDTSVEDLAPQPRKTARLSPSYRKRARAARRRIEALVWQGLLGETAGDRYVVTHAGEAALTAAGFTPNCAGFWIKPGSRTPSWAS